MNGLSGRRKIGWLVLLLACSGLYSALHLRVNAVKSEVRLAERQIVALEEEQQCARQPNCRRHDLKRALFLPSGDRVSSSRDKHQVSNAPHVMPCLECLYGLSPELMLPLRPGHEPEKHPEDSKHQSNYLGVHIKLPSFLNR